MEVRPMVDVIADIPGAVNRNTAICIDADVSILI